MADLGTIAVLLSLVLAVYACAGSVAGYKLGIPELAVSARRAAYLTLPVTLAATGALMAAFVSHDFSIEYVAKHSNRVMEPQYTWVAMYAGNEGSLLYISLVVSLSSVLAIKMAPARFARSMPWTIAILAGAQAFYFFVIAFHASPFATTDIVPADGRGINPLLLHPGMFTHPPMLMAGLAGITVPFAFAAGALIAGNYGDDWVDVARVSALIVWLILGTGLLLGAWWAYTILGWGGYWGWDPIENVALMPFLVLTAFLHSIMVQKRRGMFRMWNVVLLNIAFVLAQLGMFINRGGPVVSVHSFASSALGIIFLCFMLFSLVFAFGIFIWRYPQLKSDRPVESFLSREASFLVNNFLLLAVTFATLWGVVFPLFSDLVNGVEVSVAAPYFNRVNGPLLLGVVFVMGIGPLLPWRRATGRSLRRWLAWPAAAGVATAAGLLISGLTEPLAIVAFGVIAFVFAAIAEEWFKGSAARHRSGESWPVAWWRLVNGNRPRHGGYIVHIAILTLSIGVVGTQFFDQRTDVALKIGESAVLDNYRIEYVNRGGTERTDRIAQWVDLVVYRIDAREYEADAENWRIYEAGPSGPRTPTRKYDTQGHGYPGDRRIDTLQPWHGFYTQFNQVSVRAGIRSTPVEDLYVIPSDFLSDGRVLLRISINPLAWWLWVAGPVFILGAVVALWPAPALERRTVNAARKPTAEAGI
ncbi:MAG: heme lyase CcmF/NrfE family subunit [Dehalococcoidia bacterium]|nr:heme lyase CcmF/NrfE family subunit [Dehalococcoidia bacterium]MSQ34562.1 heme lyase CcmF/NrfE family subunit [Dehalococcoidia bacterium]